MIGSAVRITTSHQSVQDTIRRRRCRAGGAGSAGQELWLPAAHGRPPPLGSSAGQPA